MEQTKQNFEDRIRQFSLVRRGTKNATLAYRLSSFGLKAGVLGLLVLSGWLPNAFLNLALFLVLGLFLLALVIGYALRRERFRSILAEAFQMEALAGGLNSRLISAWDFVESRWFTPLTNAVIERASGELQIDFESKIDLRERDERRKHFILCLALFFALGCTPWFGFARAAANFRESWLAAREYLFPVEYEVKPAYGRHIHRLGEEIEVSLSFGQRGFRRVTLVQQVKDEITKTELAVDEQGRARQTVTSQVEAEFALHFEFGERKTESVTLVFTTLPTLVNMQTELIYPAYTALLPRTLEGLQPRILGLPNTRVTLGLTFSKELDSATVTWDDGEALPLEALGRFASVGLIHTRTRRASLQVVDTHGLSLEYPMIIDFELQRDEPPRLFVPKHLKEDMPFLEKAVGEFGFGIRAQDDFGVTRCLLKWQKSTVDNPSMILDRGEIERLVSPARRQAVASFEKVFAGQNLKPGDKISFQVEVSDNRTPDAQVTKSRRGSLFIYMEELGGLSISELGFGSGIQAGRERIAKSRRSTSVKEPEGRRSREQVRNEFEGKVATSTIAPTVRGEHGQATRDYFRLLSTLSYEGDPKEKESKPEQPADPGEAAP